MIYKTIIVPTIQKLVLFLITVAFIFTSCTPEKDWSYTAEQSKIYDNAAVVSAHPLASEVGKAILDAGGNAVDAVVAVQFALAVVYPRAGNIGGGGFMVYRDQDGESIALDFREKAPVNASRDMYLDSLENPIKGLSTKGHLSVGVPGTVAGMVDAHARYGQLSWEALIEPAIQLATEGYAISEPEMERLNRFQADFRDLNDANSPFIKDDWLTGDVLIQKDLAATLTRIKDHKKDGFYSGETAKLLLEEMQEGNGLITEKDLKEYQAVWREAIVGQYDDYKIISMPPPSSGGITLMEMLGMIEDFPIHEYGFQTKASAHLIVEAERRAYADRSEYLGDSDFYPVPVDSLLDKAYLDARIADFSSDTASVSDQLEAGAFSVTKESFETTHTSIIDKDGNAVSLTTTLNSNFGSKVIVDNAGFFLNNEMDDFSIKPGVPNQFGLVGAEANAIAPGKRMLSSMTPTIIEKDGEAYMVLGSPGGSTIITAVLQVFLNVAEFEMPLDSAVWAPRFHHQWLPDRIWVEPNAFSAETRTELEEMGHEFRDVKSIAKIKAIHRLPDGRLHAVGDKRNPDDDVSGQ